MEFLKTKKAAALVLAVSVVFGTLYGSHRSLKSRGAGITAQNELVMKDLQTRRDICANLCTVAGRYLSGGKDVEELSRLLGEDAQGVEVSDALNTAAKAVIEALSAQSLTQEDARYVSGFRAQLDSLESTISRDRYNKLAKEYNEKVLGAFPARWLGSLTGIRELPVYR